MSQITTHVLDTAEGCAASGIHVELQHATAQGWQLLATSITDDDGRASDLLPEDQVLEPGVYRLVFDTGGYLSQREGYLFYPSIPVVFQLGDDGHYHVPLLLSPYGYSTYRGT